MAPDAADLAFRGAGKDQGRMYRSEWNNEGYYLGADGVWVENPERTGN